MSFTSFHCTAHSLFKVSYRLVPRHKTQLISHTHFLLVTLHFFSFFLFFLAYPTGTGEPDPSRLLGSIVRAFLNLSVRARPGGTSPRSAGARRSRASRVRQRALSVVLRVRSTLRVRLFFLYDRCMIPGNEKKTSCCFSIMMYNDVKHS